jgi:cytochrome P450
MAAPADPLAHIPHPPQTPLIGNTLDVVRDFYGFSSRNKAAFGEVYRIRMMGRWRVAFTSADAAEYIMMDPDKLFSSKGGWADSLAKLFPGGLLMHDGEEHRVNRRIMQAAFRKPALDSYLTLMAPEIERLLQDWPTGKTFAFYPAIKALTLRLGAHVFMGLPADAPEADRLNQAFIDELAAAVTVVRKPLPFTLFRRGMKARETLIARFHDLIEERRQSDGADFLSQMCRATDEDGRHWTDSEIAEHFNFLVLAAHDTTASALTTMAWALTEYPDWQDRLRDEVDALGPGPFTPDMPDRMPLTDMMFREALRFMPPVPLVPRVALRDFEWKGMRIPAGTPVSANITMVMRSADYFTDPDRFDPERFSDNRAEDRSHRFAWAPFGGGAHKCIGLHFATLQVKAFTRALLSRYSIARGGTDAPEWQRVPTARPKNGLPVRLDPRA